MPTRILIATGEVVYVVDADGGVAARAEAFDANRPFCLAASPAGGVALCGTAGHGVLRSDDAGHTWKPSGLEGEHVTAVTVSPSDPAVVWAGTEPSAVWRSDDAGTHWTRCEGLLDLASSAEWSFPPRPETHHVRWIAVHPTDADRLWVAIEAGALVSTPDGGQTWTDRVAGGPYDTHELAVHPGAPEHLYSAAGDGYFESLDGGRTWASPAEGLDIGYLRSVAIDPGDSTVVVVSAASHPHAAYRAGRSDGRLYRRTGAGAWRRITAGWPDQPSTIAPLLVADPVSGALVAADERGVHRSNDGGRRWERMVEFPAPVEYLWGLAVARA